MISAPVQVRRLGGRQAISIQLRPTRGLSLEDVVDVIDNEILPTIRAEVSANGVTIKLEGAASALADDMESGMQANVLTAIFVIFLLLVILASQLCFAE